jgi:hypothetical protein
VAQEKQQNPSTSALIALNVIAWAAFFAIWSSWGLRDIEEGGLFYVVVMVKGFFLVSCLTVAGQLVCHFVLRKRTISYAGRFLVFSIPSVMVILFVVAYPKSEAPVPPNRTQGHLSPSGKFWLVVPIETPNLPDARPVWVVTISEIGGGVVYKDEQGAWFESVGAFWAWDEEDRVWMCNDKNDSLLYWEKVGEEWGKHAWESDEQGEEGGGIHPPAVLYPHYVRNEIR